jgi:hypothetical protein
MHLSVVQWAALGRTKPPHIHHIINALTNRAHPPKKVAPAAEGGTCPPQGGIIPMSASQSFHNFYKLELIKREKLNKLYIFKINLNICNVVTLQ